MAGWKGSRKSSVFGWPSRGHAKAKRGRRRPLGIQQLEPRLALAVTALPSDLNTTPTSGSPRFEIALSLIHI